MKMNNKKGIAVRTLALLVLTLAAIVLVFMLHGPIMELIHSITKDYFRCFLAKFLAALSSLGLGSGGFCEPIVKTISIEGKGDEYITLNRPLTPKEIEHIELFYDPVPNYWEEGWLYKYRMDEAIAEGEIYCSGRNGRGRLPLGKRWGSGIKENILKGTFVYCDNCMILMLEPNVVNYFSKNFKKEESLKEYLQKHPVRPGSAVTMWEELKINDDESDLQDRTYPTREDTIHIMFARSNPTILKEYGVKFATVLPLITGEDVPEPVNAVFAIKASDYGGLNCYNT